MCFLLITLNKITKDRFSFLQNGEGGYRLHLSDLAMGISRREIEKLFRPYGPLNEVWVASNPPCFAFINFRHRADGERALKEVDGK